MTTRDNWTETLTPAEAAELARRIEAAIVAQSPETQHVMAQTMRLGKAIGYIWSDDGAKVLVTFGGNPLVDVLRSDLTAATRHDVNCPPTLDRRPARSYDSGSLEQPRPEGRTRSTPLPRQRRLQGARRQSRHGGHQAP